MAVCVLGLQICALNQLQMRNVEDNIASTLNFVRRSFSPVHSFPGQHVKLLALVTWRWQEGHRKVGTG